MKPDKNYWSNALLLILALSFVLLYAAILSKTPFFLTGQYRTSDFLFLHQPNFKASAKDSTPPEQIVVIGIDDESRHRLDRAWPWSRAIFAAFLEQISPLKPKVIGFDFSFIGKSQNEEADIWFADELRKSGNIVLASYFEHNPSNGRETYVLPDDLFLAAAESAGFVDIPFDQEGAVRRSRMMLELAGNRGIAYSMPVQLACAFTDQRPDRSLEIIGNNVVFRLPSKKDPASLVKISVPLDRKYRIPTSFRYPREQIRYIPFWKVIAGQVGPKEIRGKIVLVGMISDIVHDFHKTPAGPMPGVFIVAQQTLMILDQDFVKKLWPSQHWIFLLVLAAAFSMIFYRLHYLYGLIVLPFAGVALYGIAVWLFLSQRLVFSLFSTLIILFFVYLLVLFYRGFWILMENTALHRQVVTDGLTGLYSHNYCLRRLKTELELCRQTGSEFSLVMIDVDYFKRVNDTYGHEQGNKVLVRIAECLRGGVRGNDVVGRYGGEEFIMILFNCNATVAGQIIEKISRAIEALTFETPKGDFHVTISAGICTSREGELKKVDDLMRFADEALYKAKADGRNRVCLHTTPLLSFIYKT